MFRVCKKPYSGCYYNNPKHVRNIITYILLFIENTTAMPHLIQFYELYIFC